MANALPRSHVLALDNIITHTMKPRLASLNPLTLTHDEFLELFADEGDRHILRTAATVASISSQGGFHHGTLKSEALNEKLRTRSCRVMFTVNIKDSYAPLLPRCDVVRPDAPEHVMSKLTNWVVTTAQNNMEVNRVSRLLWWLHNNCQGASQVRYLWPSIITLCSMDETNENLQNFANRLRELRRPQSLPSMPPEVRDAFKKTASIVAALSLLPNTTPEPVAPPEVSVQILGNDACLNEGALGWISGS